MISLAYVLVFTIAGAVCLFGLGGVRGFDYADVRWSLGSLLALSGSWSLFTAAQLAVQDPALARAVHVAALVVGISTVFAWLAFASAYAGRQYHRNRSLQAAGIAILLFIVGLKLTNPIHGQYFTSVAVAEPFPHTAIEYHAPHWFVTGFSYTAVVIGFLWLFDSFDRNSNGSGPVMLYALVLVTALPLVPYALAPSIEFLVHTNYEPLGVAVFAVGVLFYARAEFTRYSSPGHSALADNLSEGGLVLDESGLVIDHNQRAVEILGRQIPRTALESVDPTLADLEPGGATRTAYEVDGTSRTYEIERKPAADSLIAAEIVTLKDVTRVTRFERLTGVHREISEALVNVEDPMEFLRRIPDRFAAIDAYDLVWLYPQTDGWTDGPSVGRFTRAAPPFPSRFGVTAGEESAHTEWVIGEQASTEPVLRAAETGETCQHTVDPEGEAWERRLAEAGIEAVLAVPMSFGGDRECVLGVYTTAPGGFDDPERQLLEDICRRLPEAVERIETHSEALRYREAITHAGAAIVITDTEGTIQHVNPAFERLTGYAAEEAVGETPQILKSGELDDELYDRLWETIESGELFESRMINKRKDGSRYIAQQTIAPVTDEYGDPVAYVAIQVELTDQLLREQRLSVFNRVLRHNLRTAINVIDGHVTLLEDRVGNGIEGTGLPEPIRESLDTIDEQTTELTEKSETAREIENVLASDPNNASRVPVGELGDRAEEAAASQGGDCRVVTEGDFCGEWVPAQALQVVEELVENAFVHHDAEPEDVGVCVTLSRAAGDLCLTVEDDGPGISEQELIFLEEGQEDPLYHGSGLDLWKIHWLTISLGGSVTAEADGDGTTIQVTVPLYDADASTDSSGESRSAAE